ncbi:MAG: thioesterase [Candidatus Eisenbacteria bacterium]|nr:thioesterase [Candidatus Eisenbacteria bacterium]
MARIQIDFPDRGVFECSLPVRITDLNYGNHLAHDTLVSILHEARVRFFRAFDMEEWDIDGNSLLVVDLGVTYRAQVFYGQTLRIEIAIDDPGTRGCDLLYRVTDEDSAEQIALAKTGIVFFDGENERVTRMPEKFQKVVDRQFS